MSLAGGAIGPGELAIFVGYAVAGGFLLAGLLRRRRTFLLVGLAMVVSTLASSWQVPGLDPTDRIGSIIRLAIVLVSVTFIGVALFQSPAWLAECLGVKRRSREWEFDRRLKRYLRTYNELFDEPSVMADDARRQIVTEAAERIIRHVTELEPPDPDWGALARDYADLMRRQVGLARDDGLDDAERRRILKERWLALRREYQDRAKCLSTWP